MVHASLSGKLLIAMPGLNDPHFERTVIMMCIHTPSQAMGLIVNKPREALTLGEVLNHLGLKPQGSATTQSVLDGGPVQQQRGYVLHTDDFEAPDATQDVCAGVRLTATREILEAIASTDHAPKRSVLALGCSGWGAGQLEDELARNAWLVAEPSEAIIFGPRHEEKWEQAIKSIGIDPSTLSSSAGHA